MVEWELSSWDAGQLGAVLQYMYLEGKSPKEPLMDHHNLSWS